MNCENCMHRELKEAMRNPFYYAGEIPCLRCIRWRSLSDNWKKRVEMKPRIMCI